MSSTTTPPRSARTARRSAFRGLANDDYYLLDDDGGYIDDSGTGNTFNANRPIVRRLIIDSLRYWVQEMHVDGFRFDLAAVLSRDEAGQPMADPPALWDIETDPVLAGTKLIAEAWDAGGLYQVGTFVGDRWVGVERPLPRRRPRPSSRAIAGMVPAVTQRFLGSPDIYGHKRREPQASVNFVTCHDGFTLNDLVSYDAKHNEANGEANRDGTDQNLSWNCGVEGPTADPAIETPAARQVRNFLVLDLLPLGAPMLLDGRRGPAHAGGNNNAYGHDDAMSWFDWTGVERHADILRFTRALIAHPPPGRARSSTSPDDAVLLDLLRDALARMERRAVGQPDLGPDSHSVALTLRADQGALHLIFNAYWEPLDFDLPVPDVDVRRLAADRRHQPRLARRHRARSRRGARGRPPTYRAEARSVVVLAARRATAGDTAQEDDMTDAERKRMEDAGHPENGWREASPWYDGAHTSSERAWGVGPRGLHRRAATRGTRSRTTMPARAPTAGTRTGWPA